ncbi:autotransporter outer membrane beta-barrel domain-containing protein [Pelagibacterium montanilacus]|uniref:autotransporter outer membrane beta-barrel domain-containing protein n=1 Tax=Pelagibacterium montanilacus TaxID=2185280 RepID=UPI000F8F20AD|nr:autotransporter outer membrane beta-barrel domain-containing protein [Pelagibacterium montanilacus]
MKRLLSAVFFTAISLSFHSSAAFALASIGSSPVNDSYVPLGSCDVSIYLSGPSASQGSVWVYLDNMAAGGSYWWDDQIYLDSAITQSQIEACGFTNVSGLSQNGADNGSFAADVYVGFSFTGTPTGGEPTSYEFAFSGANPTTYIQSEVPAGPLHDAGEVAAEMNTLVGGFVQTRQSFISSTIEVPGLVERRQVSNAAEPNTGNVTPSANGVTANISTSLTQIEAAAKDPNGSAETELSPFNIWIDGTFMLHNREQSGDNWGSFGMVSTGADYLLSEKALIGLSFHYDHKVDPTDANAELSGDGWLAGPYASFEIGNGVFWDTSLLYGGSSNAINTDIWDGSFDTRRWMLDTSINGHWKLNDVTTVTPKLRVAYLAETVDDYVVENGSADVLDIGGFTTEQLRASFGAEIARQFMLKDSLSLTPRLGLTGGFSGLDGSGAFGQLSAGFVLQSMDAWSVDTGLLLNIEGDGQTSAGAKIAISGSF